LGILFVVALVLAWPTFGLSLVAWFVVAFLKGKSAAKASAQRHVKLAVIEPWFQERFAEFYMALDVPYSLDEEPDWETAHQCGRLIMNYLAHNPSEADIFYRGLLGWTRNDMGVGGLCDPAEAAECELLAEKGEIHFISYHAIKALMKNNSLPCFRTVDLAAVEQLLNEIPRQ